MARLKDDQATQAFRSYLEPGEQLQHWAYGVKQPHLLLMIPLFVLGVLPGAIATALLTKNYLVGLTNRRLLVLRVKNRLAVQEVSEYALNSLPTVKASTGPIFTHLKISDPHRPFAAKFPRLGMPNNRQHSMAIGAALTGRYST